MSWNVQQQTDEERGDVSPAGAAWSRARSHAGLGQRRAAAGEGRETGSLRGTSSTGGDTAETPMARSERDVRDPGGAPSCARAEALRLGTLPHGRGSPGSIPPPQPEERVPGSRCRPCPRCPHALAVRG